MNLIKLREKIIEEFAIPTDKLVFRHPPENIEGDIALLLFPLKSWNLEVSEKVIKYISSLPEVAQSKVIDGYLNIVFNDRFYIDFLFDEAKKILYHKSAFRGDFVKSGGTTLIEFCSPNTNKPLHLGHLRNIFLGESISRIFELVREKVLRTNLLNDRGIHICKAMYAWDKMLNRKIDKKGDHLAGDCYVIFENASKKDSNLLNEAYKMLKKWEDNDSEVRALWKDFVNMVIRGFEETLSFLKVKFDRVEYESQTYQLGKELVINGLSKGLFKQDEKGIYFEENDKKKYLLRSDQTSIYITQDIGVAFLRWQEIKDLKEIYYVVASEQNEHFKMLFKVLNTLDYPQDVKLRHISYGLVLLPEGKMKSREGKVVDADNLISEVKELFIKKYQGEEAKIAFLNEELEEVVNKLTIGAIAYHLLRISPSRNILFKIEESVAINGNSGPFIQYTGARINSLLKKGNFDINLVIQEKISQRASLLPEEKNILRHLLWLSPTIERTIKEVDPSILANFLYTLCQKYNSFYQNIPILISENDSNRREFRLLLSWYVLNVIKEGSYLMCMEIPEKM